MAFLMRRAGRHGPKPVAAWRFGFGWLRAHVKKGFSAERTGLARGLRRAILGPGEAGQRFFLSGQVQRQQGFKREECAPDGGRYLSKAARRFSEWQKRGKPLGQGFDFGMHPQQYPKRVLPTEPGGGFRVKRAFLGSLMRQQFITKAPFQNAQGGKLRGAVIQVFAGATKRLGQIAEPRMFGNAHGKASLTRKPRYGAIAGQQGAQCISNGRDINRFLQ